MKVSLNTIRFLNQQYGSAGDPAPDGPEALASRIGAQLGAIEETAGLGGRYDKIVLVRVVSVAAHPNADRLHICMIDDAGAAAGVPRDAQGHVQVVCGAPNVREGIIVAWLPPGAVVPESAAAGEPFTLEARELRGVISNGMLASARELGFGDDHDGILEITNEGGAEPTPGTLLADICNLRDDVIYDIENKMFTHRPDCFGLIGVARELAAIQRRPYKSPAWYAGSPENAWANLPVGNPPLRINVVNDVPQLVPRFVAVSMRGVKVKPSPLYMQSILSRAGIRPINNIVDVTNYLMLLTGQPLHAYDYDKLQAAGHEGGPAQELAGTGSAASQNGETAELHVRHPNPGEKLTLLNGKTVEPGLETIVIASRGKLLGIGGIMGGQDTEVDAHTTNIVLECATFDMYAVRRASMALGLFSDAATRFTKGQSPLQNDRVALQAVKLIQESAGGDVVYTVDDNHAAAEVMARGAVHPPVRVSAAFINARLGLQLPVGDIAQLLQNAEFAVEQTDAEMTVTAPFWRTDIEIPEDVVEEVGRLYGYDHLPLELPKRDIAPAPKDALLELKTRLRRALVTAGANEALSYSFVHGNLLARAGQDSGQAYRLANALSPDLQYFRLSITPSLLDKIHANVKAGYGAFTLFELGKVHCKGCEQDGLPQEFERLAAVFAADGKSAQAYGGAAYYQARAQLAAALRACGLASRARFEPLTPGDPDPASAYYAPGRAAVVTVDSTVIGRVGEYSPAVAKAFKLPEYCAGFELGLMPLLRESADAPYTPLPRFPAVEQDICLKVAAGAPYQQLFAVVQDAINASRPAGTIAALTPVDIYQRPDDPGHKQITLRLRIASYEKTLRDEEVSALLSRAADAAQQQLQAERI